MRKAIHSIESPFIFLFNSYICERTAFMPLFDSEGALLQVDPYGGPNADLRAGRDFMREIVADSLAKIQADAAGPLVFAPVAAGESLLKESGDIRLLDSDARIADAKRASVHEDSNRSLARIFQCIGQDLFDDKGKPFIIGQDTIGSLLIFESDLPVDEFTGKIPDRLTDDVVKRVFPDHIINAAGVQFQIGQSHVHILLDSLQIIQ